MKIGASKHFECKPIFRRLNCKLLSMFMLNDREILHNKKEKIMFIKNDDRLTLFNIMNKNKDLK